jgi:hypothetical protein
MTENTRRIRRKEFSLLKAGSLHNVVAVLAAATGRMLLRHRRHAEEHPDSRLNCKVLILIAFWAEFGLVFEVVTSPRNMKASPALLALYGSCFAESVRIVAYGDSIAFAWIS